MRLNAIGNVHLVCSALSDHNATEALFLSSPCDSSASIVEGFRPSDYYRADCSVLTIAGDQFFDARNVHAIAVLKIDVEGGELAVLRGMQRTIMRTRRRVFKLSWLFEQETREPAPRILRRKLDTQGRPRRLTVVETLFHRCRHRRARSSGLLDR